MVLDGYVRVSVVGGRSGERFISPAVQRDEIVSWARRHDAQLAHVFEELDESGARSDRPLLQRALARIEAGESDGIVVAYLSRFGRSLVDALEQIDRISRAGGTFVSAQEGLDFSTDAGRLVLRVLFSVAEWERDRVRSFWAVARSRAIARGVCIPTRSFGYQRTRAGRLTPDPVEAPLVRQVFRRRASEWSISELRAFLESTGVPTGAGNHWTNNSVRALLRSRRYLGELRHGEFVNPHAHEPLIDEATWQLAQSRHVRTPPTRTPAALLGGILRCAGCRRVLQSNIRHAHTSRETRAYCCNSRGPCPARAQITDAIVEPYLEAIFWQELPRIKETRVERQLRHLEGEVQRREVELTKYRDNPRLVVTLGNERFEAGLEIRMRRLEQAQVAFARAGGHATHRGTPPADLRDRWASLSVAERRAALAEVIEVAFLRRGAGRVEDRLYVCRHGRAPSDLPPPNPRGPIETRPFNPPASARPIVLRGRDPQWSSRQLSDALAPFLEGRNRWPSFREFQEAGLALLYRQVQLHGGPRRIASELELPFTAGQSVRGYTEDRVRKELSRYLAGEVDWPTVREFRAAGRNNLRVAVDALGGAQRWAHELGYRGGKPSPVRQRWSYDRIRAEVSEFTRGRVEWPARREFIDAGLLSLYAAVGRYDARERLADELGLFVQRGIVGYRTHWNEPTIRAALDAFLEGRTRWPSAKEFRAAGLASLHQALHATPGRRAAWARAYHL